MSEHLRYLSQHARMPISCIPNAGLPSVVDGADALRPHPRQLAEYHARFITELGVRSSAAAAAPRPEHLARGRRALPRPRRPRRAHPVHEPGATSIYSLAPFDQDTSFLIIGERTNANGSKKFREAMLDADWDTCVQMAKDQVKEGAHVLDVCVDYVGRDGTRRHGRDRPPLRHPGHVPLVLDSTEPQVMEAGLQWLGGRAILNSANLEDGEAPGSRLDRVFTLAREYGAAVICLLIDEEGQARDVEWKLRIAHRIHDLAVEPLRPRAGRPDLRRADVPAVHRRRRPAPRRAWPPSRRSAASRPSCPACTPRSACPTSRSASSRRPATCSTRCSCTSACEAGLDSAIVHAARIMPLNRIPDEQREVCLDLIYDRRDRRDGLRPAAEAARGVRRRRDDGEVVKEDRSGWPVEQAAVAAHHRRRPRRARPPTSTRRWPTACRRSTSSTTCCSPA